MASDPLGIVKKPLAVKVMFLNFIYYSKAGCQALQLQRKSLTQP
jgi:hypothetical protein